MVKTKLRTGKNE